MPGDKPKGAVADRTYIPVNPQFRQYPDSLISGRPLTAPELGFLSWMAQVFNTKQLPAIRNVPNAGLKNQLGLYEGNTAYLYPSHLDSDTKTYADTLYPLAHEVGHHIENLAFQGTTPYPPEPRQYDWEQRADMFARALLQKYGGTVGGTTDNGYWKTNVPVDSNYMNILLNLINSAKQK